MAKLVEVLRLTRIEHSLLLVIAVIAAELLAGGPPGLPALALSLVTPVFISMGAFAINDYFDIAVDAKNGKDRPLVTGTLSRGDALYTAAACMGIGILASFPLGWPCLVIALLFAFFSFLYSYRLKETLLLGNAYIALTMVIPFIFGSYAASGGPGIQIMLISLMVFFSGLAREIHGTIRDYMGDVKERGIVSLPGVVGPGKSAAYALVFYAVAVLLSAYLFVLIPPFRLNPAFGIMIAVSDALLIYVSVAQLDTRRSGRAFYGRIRNLSLAGMGIALVAILIASAYI